LRWVRQRSFAILNPCEVAGIKPSAALVAFEEVLSLVKRWSPDALAHDGSARPRLVHWHDRDHVHLAKNQAPVSRGPILYGARRTSGRACHCISYCHGGCRYQLKRGRTCRTLQGIPESGGGAENGEEKVRQKEAMRSEFPATIASGVARAIRSTFSTCLRKNLVSFTIAGHPPN
jgi:hypothetical protein